MSRQDVTTSPDIGLSPDRPPQIIPILTCVCPDRISNPRPNLPVLTSGSSTHTALHHLYNTLNVLACDITESNSISRVKVARQSCVLLTNETRETDHIVNKHKHTSIQIY